MDLLEILEQYQLQRRYLSIFTVAVLAALNGSSKKRRVILRLAFWYGG